METSGASGGKCCCMCHKMMGVFVVLFGLVFLLKTLDVITPKVAGIAWPVIVILAGLQSMFSRACKCCST